MANQLLGALWRDSSLYNRPGGPLLDLREPAVGGIGNSTIPELQLQTAPTIERAPNVGANRKQRQRIAARRREIRQNIRKRENRAVAADLRRQNVGPRETQRTKNAIKRERRSIPR